MATAKAKATPKPKVKSSKEKIGLLAKLSRIGKSLLFPIAMLPVAALLLRIGAEVPGTNKLSQFVGSFLLAGGNAIFGTLPILFAIGVGFGLSKDSRGEAAISSFVTMSLLMFMMSSGATFGGAKGIDIVEKIYGTVDLGGAHLDDFKGGFHRIFTRSYDSILSGNVLNGILVGMFVSFIYNNFNGIELPSILGFFSGRRLIPVLSILGGLILGLVYAVIFPWIGFVLFQFSNALAQASGNRWGNAAIMGIYGIINRLLIPFGLHHIPNTLFWFQLPLQNTHTGLPLLDSAGQIVQGDIFGFLNGEVTGNGSGTFQSGFFPIMMFGLPALAVSLWFNAEGDEQKRRVAALLGGSAIVSFFTGITEPIEFSFMFAAPALYGMHAVLTGIFGFITGLFGIQLGFGFSAGFVDYVLSIPKSVALANDTVNHTGFGAVMAHPAWIWVIGAGAAASYFFLSTLLIKKFNVGAPGRGENKLGGESSDETATSSTSKNTPAKSTSKSSAFDKDAAVILKGVGGTANISNLEWCATRLRFTLKDGTKVDDKSIKATSAMGTMKMGDKGYQVIIGPKVEMMGEAIKKIMK